jgi:hypothetical protein
MKHNPQTIYSDLDKHEVQAQIDKLTDGMNTSNIVESMNQIGALTQKLRVMKRTPDFTTSNQMDWGVSVIAF